MTCIYFIRHCESDNTYEDGLTRPLTEKGWRDRERVTLTMQGIHLHAIYSSPYKRTLDTVSHLAQSRGIAVQVEHGLHERVSGQMWNHPDFTEFLRRQWADFDYTLEDCESLRMVQTRNMEVICRLLNIEYGNTIAVATHGCALSTILNALDFTFGYEDSMRIRNVLPYILRLEFDGHNLISSVEIDLK